MWPCQQPRSQETQRPCCADVRGGERENENLRVRYTAMPLTDPTPRQGIWGQRACGFAAPAANKPPHPADEAGLEVARVLQLGGVGQGGPHI